MTDHKWLIVLLAGKCLLLRNSHHLSSSSQSLRLHRMTLLHILTTHVSAVSLCVKCYWSWVLNSVFQLTICVSYMLYMGFYSLRAGRSEDRIPVGARLPAPVQTGLAAHPASCRMATGSLSWGYSDRGVALTTHNPSSAEVKERVELYLCFISGPSWPVLGRTVPFIFTVGFCNVPISGRTT